MILVTGATGFVGSHLLLHLLEKEEKIRALYRNQSKIAFVKSLFRYYKKEFLFDKIEWVEADITNIPQLEIAFAEAAFVYHCAALVSFDPDDEAILRKTNIEGTANIVNLSLTNSVKKLCYVSSIAALGDLPEHENTTTEATEWNPEKYHSDYAISKYGAEMEIWRGQQEGLNVVIVNPGVIIGACQPNEGSGVIFSKVKNGLKYYTKGTTGFIAVEDVVKIIAVLMESDISGEKFILVSENVTFEKLLKDIAVGFNVKPPYQYAKKWLTEILWRLDWLANIFGKKRTFSKSTAKSMHHTTLYSNEKIKNAVGYEFVAVEEAVKMTAAYFSEGSLD
ncbi:NAD-dependent epimerase/dehydratase family protein [Flavobacterium sp. 3HN19-14]|uniref:NAD-dependent epimerase/dehydratase family protein n=1 Tax=Flavobacterium sp. 3HN19-14 TaxID=3448133 RepID=UPI003EE3089C